MMTPLAFDAQALAKALNVSVRHVETLLASGRLPRPLRLGRRRVWSADEIRQWLLHGAPPVDAWERIKAEEVAR